MCFWRLLYELREVLKQSMQLPSPRSPAAEGTGRIFDAAVLGQVGYPESLKRLNCSDCQEGMTDKFSPALPWLPTFNSSMQ
jgi:hypothetical protein